MADRSSLFNPYEATTVEGRKLEDRIYKEWMPLLREYIDRGYSVREVEAIAVGMISSTMAAERLHRGLALRRLEQRVGPDKAHETVSRLRGYDPTN